MKFKTAARRWLKHHKLFVKQSTYSLYTYSINEYILPYFGDMDLNDLSNETLQLFVNDLYLKGGLKHKKPLRVKTVKNIFTITKQIIIFSFEYKYCKEFYIKVRIPRQNYEVKVETFNRYYLKKLKQFLVEKDNTKSLGILIAIFTGIRIGELCGLKWEDIDLNKNTISINKTVQRINYKNKYNTKKSYIEISEPKTISSIRIIPISSELRKYLITCERVKDNFVLTNSIDPDEPRNIRKHYSNYLKESNIPFLKFHALRHSFATNLISLGAEPKVVSQMLGHSKVSITLDLYVHPNLKDMKKSINLLDKL